MVIFEVRSEIKFEHSDNRLYSTFSFLIFFYRVAVRRLQIRVAIPCQPANLRGVAGCPRRRGSERPRSGLERGEGFPLLIIQTTVQFPNLQGIPLTATVLSLSFS